MRLPPSGTAGTQGVGSSNYGLLMGWLLEAEKEQPCADGEGMPGSLRRKGHPAEGKAPDSPAQRGCAPEGPPAKALQIREGLAVASVWAPADWVGATR